MKKKWGILGTSGYVGSVFSDHLNNLGVSTYPITRQDYSFSDYSSLAKLITSNQLEFIVNCAGFTGKPNVDACENQKSETLLGNAVLPGLISNACSSVGVPWGHVSSGCIFSGRREDGQPFTESDEPNFSFRQPPCSFYSGSKALGEEVIAGDSSCYIWRLRIPFDNHNHSRNYLSKLIRYERLLEVENSISHLGHFVRACRECVEKNVPYGIYNVVNGGSITTSDVVEIIKKHKIVNKEFKYFKDEDEFMSTAALTPRSSCVMSNKKLLAAGVYMPPVEEALDEALSNWIE